MELQTEFGFVVATILYCVVVHHVVMAFGVGKARKTYEVKFPDLYANKDNCPNPENMRKFNCVQRGHQNSLEILQSFYALLLVAGAKHPVVASIAGCVFVTGRLLYFKGYSKGDPDKRFQGGFYILGLFTLMGVCVKIAVELLLQYFKLG